MTDVPKDLIDPFLLSLSVRQFFTTERLGIPQSYARARVVNTLLNEGAETLRDVIELLAKDSGRHHDDPSIRNRPNFGDISWNAMLRALASEGISFPIDPRIFQGAKLKPDLSPVLAQSGRLIGLALVPSYLSLQLGNRFDRDHEKYGGSRWTVIKYYEGEEAQKLKSLIMLLGFEVVEKFFEVKVMET